MPKSLTLEVTTSDGHTEVHANLTQFPLSFGRDDSSGIQINDSQCSRIHAAIMQSGDGYWLIDEQSTNGTYREDGEKINRIKISSGSRVRIGKCWIKFVVKEVESDQTEIAQPGVRVSGNSLPKPQIINTPSPPPARGNPIAPPPTPPSSAPPLGAVPKKTGLEPRIDQWIEKLGESRVAFGSGLAWIAFASGVFAASFADMVSYFIMGWLVCLASAAGSAMITYVFAHLTKKVVPYKTYFLTYISYYAFACFTYELKENSTSLWPESNLISTVVGAASEIVLILFFIINLRWIWKVSARNLIGLATLGAVAVLLATSGSLLNSQPRWKRTTSSPSFSVKAKEVPAHFYVSSDQLTNELTQSLDHLEKRAPAADTE